MKVEQIYTGCLAHGAYYIISGKQAAVVDPLREVQPYIDRAIKDGVKITHIFETHFHADFVSGHITLAKKTGAKIIYGPNATPDFDAHVAKDGEIFNIGDIKIKVLHTPGHTMESSCFLLIDENGKNHSIFTGDTLFLGDVGRPDLAQKANLTMEDLASHLYESLMNKIMPLEDNVIVYPGHGAGSACGKNMMQETVDTLGNQKKVNYALQTDKTKEEIIKEITSDLLPPPQYFPMNVKMNKSGYDSIDEVLEKGKIPLSPDDMISMVEHKGALVLDVRSPEEFTKGHVPKSIFVGLDGSFAPWVGELIVDVYQPLVLIVETGREEEAITRLARIGFDHVLGYLEGGMDAWIKAGKEVDSIKNISADQLLSYYDKVKNQIVDVRAAKEHLSEHVLGSINKPLSDINSHLEYFKDKVDQYVHCAGGYRSVIACSILKSRGIHNLINVSGGFKAIKETKLPLSEYVCPTTINA